MTSFATLKRALQLAALPLALAGLSGCATGFNADVSRFASQMPAPQGQSFAIVAEDPALAGGLEFSQYAVFVKTNMERLGYVQAASPDSASLLVRFDYGVDKGREKVVSTGFARDPFYSPWMGYRPFVFSGPRGPRMAYLPYQNWGYGFYDPFFDRSDVSSYTVYTSGIDLKIDSRSSGQRLFEGKAEALSTSNRLQYLVPNLVEAMFTDFPGNSGETVRISVKPEGQAATRK
ncbi:MAG: hypothetical protein RLZZ08_688 [Pseudomonadota bacterium]